MKKVDRRCTGSHVGDIEIGRRFGRLLGGRPIARPRNDLKGANLTLFPISVSKVETRAVTLSSP